jgi:LacI family transcriptional regulator
MGVSIHDVARASSLSCETILEVLVSPSSLEPEVVRFVMKTIRETGYLETFSRWKTDKRGPSVAVLTPMLDSPSVVEIFKGIDRAMSSLGLNTSMVTLPTRFSLVFREELLSTLLTLNFVDAVITINIKPDEKTVQHYNKIGKPLILMQTVVAGGQSVLLENQKGMAIGINYLYNKGYRSIGLLNGPTGGNEPGSVPSERLIGYLMALHRLGLEFDESLVFETSDYDADSGAHGFEYFRKRGKLPDAVFCASGDMTAIGFIKAAREAGVSVPKDLAVMGYDDLPLAHVVTPGLTTIRQRLMIAGAGALVLAYESSVNGPGDNLVIMPELVEREST